MFTATQMRKYVATTIQLLDMTESELRLLTDHLGHSVAVHKQWYRKSERTAKVTEKVTKRGSLLPLGKNSLLSIIGDQRCDRKC